ncbi:Rid family detoxifying hydrolase [Estrella lausannensis]|uniref:Endoribonuclease L-PSP n=1 Tax=Estrella lausannensis TaxID=483423 RepID=A0A0H5E843_9BACT|nr:Rid family detoxifying hydrolase [Estrella lausannensis]CRX39520.1 Endoribonuclease L-PSP [Estrella lausannensis]
MKSKIETSKAPKALGPYSQAILQKIPGAEMLYVSGQLPIDPATGTLIQGTIEEQTQQVLKNIQAILEAAAMSFEHVVKVEIFLLDLRDFSKVNGTYSEVFGEPSPPARQTVQAARLPLDSPIEISCIAVKA